MNSLKELLTLGPELLCSLGIVSIYGGIYYLYAPRFHLEISPTKNDKELEINMKQKNYPLFHAIEHKSLTCLQERGHSIIGYSSKDMYSVYKNNIKIIQSSQRLIKPESLLTVRVADTIPQFLEDCKDCGVHSDVTYYRFPSLFGESKQFKRYHWHRCYKGNDKELW